jgi:hypothetical protein
MQRPRSRAKGIEGMSTAEETLREELLIDGLADWLPLAHVDSRIAREHPLKSLVEQQDLALDTIRSLVSDDLMQLGDLTGEDGRLRVWETPLDESMQRIRDMYVDQYGDASAWLFRFWLNQRRGGNPHRVIGTRGPVGPGGVCGLIDR